MRNEIERIEEARKELGLTWKTLEIIVENKPTRKLKEKIAFNIDKLNRLLRPLKLAVRLDGPITTEELINWKFIEAEEIDNGYCIAYRGRYKGHLVSRNDYRVSNVAEVLGSASFSHFSRVGGVKVHTSEEDLVREIDRIKQPEKIKK